MNAGALLLTAAVVSAFNCQGPALPARCTDRTQFGGDQTHGNQTCAVAGELERKLADVVYDPFVPEERAEDGSGNGLRVHFQPPLIQGNDLYMVRKSGKFVSCNPPGSNQPAPCGFENFSQETWSEVAYRVEGDRLVERWSYTTDWKPLAIGSEEMFSPALGDGVIYVPGAGGTVHELDTRDGKELGLINPYGGAIDRNATVVSGPLTIDRDGTLYFNTIRFRRMFQSLLVKVTRNGTLLTAAYEQFVQGAPAPDALCETIYQNDPSLAPPFPPPAGADGTVAPPPSQPCEVQRPAFDQTPAVSEDGQTVYVASVAADGFLDGFVTALRASDLTPRWSTSLRHLFDDGCGVGVPDDGDAVTHPSHCRPGAPRGVDPFTGRKGDGRVVDFDSSSPVALPDGVLYGTFSAYNHSRGHLVKLDRDGHLVASFDFGWDEAPAVWRHDGTYSIIAKDNHYNDLDDSGVDKGPFFVTQLDANLKIEWQFKSTNTQSCNPDASGKLVCTETHPNGFEWCIDSPAVDALGRVFVNSEDGNVYAIGQGGVELGRVFQGESLPSSYTPVTIDAHGRVFTLNGGHLILSGAR